MEWMPFLLFCGLLTVSSAIFFPWINLPGQQRQTMMNICIYSTNPARYQPKCFLCPSTVYTNVLRACVDAVAIPNNVTYTQASCIEQNCGIVRGKRSLEAEEDPDGVLREELCACADELEDYEDATF